MKKIQVRKLPDENVDRDALRQERLEQRQKIIRERNLQQIPSFVCSGFVCISWRDKRSLTAGDILKHMK